MRAVAHGKRKVPPSWVLESQPKRARTENYEKEAAKVNAKGPQHQFLSVYAGSQSGSGTGAALDPAAASERNAVVAATKGLLRLSEPLLCTVLQFLPPQDRVCATVCQAFGASSRNALSWPTALRLSPDMLPGGGERLHSLDPTEARRRVDHYAALLVTSGRVRSLTVENRRCARSDRFLRAFFRSRSPRLEILRMHDFPFLQGRRAGDPGRDPALAHFDGDAFEADDDDDDEEQEPDWGMGMGERKRRAVAVPECPQLQELAVFDAERLSGDNLARCFPNLTRLTLRKTLHGSDPDRDRIWAALPKLRSLTALNCEAARLAALGASLAKLPDLRELSLHVAEWPLLEGGGTLLAELPRVVPWLTRVTTGRVPFLSDLSDGKATQQLLAVLAKCPRLRELHLNRAFEVFDGPAFQTLLAPSGAAPALELVSCFGPRIHPVWSDSEVSGLFSLLTVLRNRRPGLRLRMSRSSLERLRPLLNTQDAEQKAQQSGLMLPKAFAEFQRQRHEQRCEALDALFGCLRREQARVEYSERRCEFGDDVAVLGEAYCRWDGC